MDVVILAALITGWATIMGAVLEVRYRTNGKGPLAQRLDELKADVTDIKSDVNGLKLEFYKHIKNNGGQ